MDHIPNRTCHTCLTFLSHEPQHGIHIAIQIVTLLPLSYVADTDSATFAAQLSQMCCIGKSDFPHVNTDACAAETEGKVCVRATIQFLQLLPNTFVYNP